MPHNIFFSIKFSALEEMRELYTDQEERSRTEKNRLVQCSFTRRVFVNRAHGFDMRSRVMESWLHHRVCRLHRGSHPQISSLK